KVCPLQQIIRGGWLWLVVLEIELGRKRQLAFKLGHICWPKLGIEIHSNYICIRFSVFFPIRAVLNFFSANNHFEKPSIVWHTLVQLDVKNRAAWELTFFFRFNIQYRYSVKVICLEQGFSALRGCQKRQLKEFFLILDRNPVVSFTALPTDVS